MCSCCLRKFVFYTLDVIKFADIKFDIYFRQLSNQQRDTMPLKMRLKLQLFMHCTFLQQQKQLHNRSLSSGVFLSNCWGRGRKTQCSCCYCSCGDSADSRTYCTIVNTIKNMVGCLCSFSQPIGGARCVLSIYSLFILWCQR